MDLIAVGLLTWGSYVTLVWGQKNETKGTLQECKEYQMSETEERGSGQCPVIYKVLRSLEDKGYLNA